MEYIKDQSIFDKALGEFQQKLLKECSDDNVIISNISSSKGQLL